MTAAASSEPFVFAPGGPAAAETTGTGPHTRGPFTGGSSAHLVDQARQEITQIVREVAAASHQPRQRAEYLRFLADRVLRAMAGHGVVIWTRPDQESSSANDYSAECRLGRVTDVALVDEAVAVHQCLLSEVADDGVPVVVPSTPDARQPDVPANPLPYPAAIVPIRIDPSSRLPEGLIEVFLEDGGTAASQRGSLRFLAQMADLAGEFLRTRQLRKLTQLLDATNRVDAAVERLHRMTSTRSIQTAWVDLTAELLQLDRVALCQMDGGKPKLVAVSHVDRIDQHGDAAKKIRHAAQKDLQPQHGVWMAERVSDAGQEDESTSQPEEPSFVVALHPHSQWRLIGYRTSSQTALSDEVYWGTLCRLLSGGSSAWTAARRVESIPGGRWFSRLLVQPEWNEPSAGMHAGGTPSQSAPNTPRMLRVSRIRRLLFGGVIAILASVLLCLPVPMLVPVSGVIRPLKLDTYHAASDAVVKTLHVQHGQTVQQGDLLATLVSTDLQEQETQLLGRRAVLLRQREQFNQTLMAHSASADETRASDGRELDEEIDSIHQQLELIRQSKEQLVVRAENSGRVDAWRLNERLANRPLRRGDPLLSIIAETTDWVVDARIPQTRLQSVDSALQSDRLTAEVGTTWSSQLEMTGTAQRFGPIVPDPSDGTPSVVMRLALDQPPELGDQPLSEVPARVTLHCGQTPFGWMLVQDFVHWCQVQWGGYF
ncbi:HlyD family efflux transporter periplasmic adaptor subunit [Rhodopirellula sp. JC740]|uniref:HlyD family efflux transporter periplasmic adaptor subunit n=1 Tax=Rhodopirellula halodulae TaxID=2894198 RepID=A0ABS8NP28_9BACT|nr:HlyD family efflux transporter periplasmic adaptor subunit [Rhodopirellula sp. JC740]MCC9645331.1 HlyD family efflux transporter periplasmic adaptor subunit [Rhodopirellula sp. JC740]